MTKKVNWTIPVLLGASMLCFHGAAEARAESQLPYLAEIIETMKAAWPNDRTVNLVFHGHSVPMGYMNDGYADTFNAYPHLLHRALKERFPNAVINVIVTGVAGESSRIGAGRFKRDVLSHNPDVVMIDYLVGDKLLTNRQINRSMLSMIRQAKKQKVKVILLTATPDPGAGLLDSKDPLSERSAMLRVLAERHKVALVDIHAAFEKYVENGGKLEDLMSQEVHPNRRGHDLVVRQLLELFPAEID